jgi:hypothetical protein
MPARRSAETTPDLFSARSLPTAPHGKAQASSPELEPRHVLPRDLKGALKRLHDRELDELLAAVTDEVRSRGRLPSIPQQKSVDVKSPPGRRPVGELADKLSRGKLNALHAAFKAGVKPSVIARQFGISQSEVRRALARAHTGR